jgi:adenylate kinase
MLALNVSEETCKRLVKRGETSGRSDDSNEGVIRARIAEYNSKTAAVLNIIRNLIKWYWLKEKVAWKKFLADCVMR